MTDRSSVSGSSIDFNSPLRRSSDAFEASKKPRIKTACLSCRQRKSKCNGQIPCSNCQYYGKTCLYPELKSQKTRGKGRTNNRQEIFHINQRLSMLEDVLLKISSHYDKRDKTKQLLKMVSRDSQYSVLSTDDDSDASMGGSTKPSSRQEEGWAGGSVGGVGGGSVGGGSVGGVGALAHGYLHGVSSGGGVSAMSGAGVGPGVSGVGAGAGASVLGISGAGGSTGAGPGPDNDDPTVGTSLTPPGQHSILLIFNRSQLAYYIAACPDESVLTPIKRLPSLVNTLVNDSCEKWLNPPRKELVMKYGKNGYFPLNANFISEILDAYYNQHFWFSFVLDLDTLKSWFKTYFSQINYQFKYSQLVAMNISLALCLRCRLQSERDTVHRAKYPTLSTMNEKQLYDLQTVLFNTSIAYYDQISVLNEGIVTIQALIMVIVYVEAQSGADFRLVYMLTSLLARYAQELGIDRLDELNQSNQKDYSLYRKLWWLCEYIDVSSCYRTGRSCLLNSCNINDNSQLDTEFKSISNVFNVKDHIWNAPNENIIISREFVQFYFQYFMISLKRIQRISYTRLFSLNAQNDIKDSNVLIDRIFETERSLDQLMKKIDPHLRVKLPWYKFPENEPSNHSFKLMADYDDMTISFPSFLFKLDFLCHYLVVYRIGAFNDTGSYQKYFAERAITCARTIVRVTNSININHMCKFLLSWTLSSALVGLLVLLEHCISHPKEKAAVDDCNQIIKCAVNYFNSRKTVVNFPDFQDVAFYEQKICFNDIIVRTLVRLLLTVLSKEWNRDLIDENNLHEYFELVEKACPELFISDNHARLEPNIANLINPEVPVAKMRLGLFKDHQNDGHGNEVNFYST